MPIRKNTTKNTLDELRERSINSIAQNMVQLYKEQGTDFDYQQYLKGILGHFIECALEAELEAQLGYAKYERPEDKKPNYRNGSYKRKVMSKHGEIEFSVPRDRAGEYTPTLIPKGQRRISDIDDKIIALYRDGRSLRDIVKEIEEIYGARLSAETISEITDKIIPEIREWKNRPLQRIYAYIFMDAAYFNVRENGHNVKKACYSAIGVNTQGQREVLGMWLGNSESASYWCNILQELRSRGVEDVILFAVDGLHGMVQAIHAVYPDAMVQRCVVHQLRNCFKLVPYKDRRALARDMRGIYRAPTLEAAEGALDNLEDAWGSKYPRVIKAWRANWEELSTFYSLPFEMRRLVYTTNTIEAYNRGLRKFTKNHVQFPNDQALEKVLYLAMKRITETWSTQVYCWHSILNQLMLQFPDRIHDEDLELVI